jgi:HK97 family phage major capsid protein
LLPSPNKHAVLSLSSNARLWANSLITGQPPTFYGKPVIILDGMDDIETGKLPVLFGSLKGYEIWDRARATMQP